MELEEYMKGSKKPTAVRQQLDQVLGELKAERISKRLVNFMEENPASGPSPQAFALVLPKYDSLYDYVNEENVRQLVLEVENLYQIVEVSFEMAHIGR